jgi:hypothetical protein
MSILSALLAPFGRAAAPGEAGAAAAARVTVTARAYAGAAVERDFHSEMAASAEPGVYLPPPGLYARWPTLPEDADASVGAECQARLICGGQRAPRPLAAA